MVRNTRYNPRYMRILIYRVFAQLVCVIAAAISKYSNIYLHMFFLCKFYKTFPFFVIGLAIDISISRVGALVAHSRTVNRIF